VFLVLPASSAHKVLNIRHSSLAQSELTQLSEIIILKANALTVHQANIVQLWELHNQLGIVQRDTTVQQEAQVKCRFLVQLVLSLITQELWENLSAEFALLVFIV
jgi:hypothetical protein